MFQNVIIFPKTYNSQLTNRQECVLMVLTKFNVQVFQTFPEILQKKYTNISEHVSKSNYFSKNL